MMRTCLLLALFITSAAGIADAQLPPENSGKHRLCMGEAPSAARPVADGTAVPTPATISQVAWLSGIWIGTMGPTTVEERWTPPAGGSMISVGRTLRNGALTAFEFVCIVERRGGLVYTAMPNGHQPATDFTMTKIEGTSVTFENPAHDFPKMIRYTLKADGTLEAIVSGAATDKPEVFTYKKQ
jgi:hypothetical protein